MAETSRSPGPDPESREANFELPYALEHKVASILDRGLRRHVVREQLEAATPREAYAVVEHVLQNAPPDQPARVVLRDVVFDLLYEEGALGYGLRRELYEIAARENDEVSMAVLRTQASMQAAGPGATRVPKELEDIPLGMRRTLAKQDDRARLEQLCRDPDPIVIRHLLRNPRLREEDVIRIAALRPVPETTLDEIARSPRWSTQPRIRVALARNPRTPVELCSKMVSSIPLVDLRVMRRDPDLHPDVQLRIEHELKRRM
jgi:hypothetical protein